MAIDVLGNYVEVATDYGGNISVFPFAHLDEKPLHPRELVVEFICTYRVSIRKINVNDTDTGEDDFKISGMRVRFVARENIADGFDRGSGEDCDAVVGLLGYSDTLVAQFLKGRSRELGPFEFL